MEKLIIVGIGETADIAYEHFTADQGFEIVAFAVNQKYKTASMYKSMPLLALEELQNYYSSNQCKVFVAMSSGRLNRDRQKVYEAVKQLGYSCVSYISPRAFIASTATIGENCFIFENNSIQHGVDIGNNVVIWSNSCIAHQTKIHDHVFIAPSCTICGYCEVKNNTFLGANSTLADHTKVGADCFVGMGCIINKTVSDNTFIYSNKSVAANISAKEFCKLDHIE